MKKPDSKAQETRMEEVMTDQSGLNVSRKSRRFKVGIYSMIVTLVVLAIAVVLNVIVSKLPSTVTKIDTSFNDMFTVTDQTKTILSKLDMDVTVYLVSTTGQEDNSIVEMLQRYQALSPHVKVVYRDPTLYPNFVPEYTDETLYNNSIIIVSDKRSKVIDYNDIYHTEYTYSYAYGDYYSQTYFNGEDELTSGIDFVTTDNLPTVYTLTGHGESALSDTFTAAVEKANLKLEELSLIATSQIPEDTEALLINAPTADLGSDELKLILEFMENGGRVLLTTSYSVSHMPNLLTLLENYGVEPVDGLMVDNKSGSYLQYTNYLLPSIQEHEITQPLLDNRYYVLLPGAQGIKPIDAYRSTLTIEDLLVTSDESFSKVDVESVTMTKEAGDIDGPFAVGVAVSEAYMGETTKLVWFSTSYLLDDNINALVGGGNSTLFVDSLAWLCDVEDAYTIPSHSLGVNALQTPPAWIYILTALFILAIPAAVIVVGIVRLRRRKKR